MRVIKRLIIADDHPLFRMGLKYGLEAEGFEVLAEANTGQEALEMCATLLPDIVLLDVKMPELDGIETCRLLRERDPQLIIVMLTTFDEPAIVKAAGEAGATSYLSKETDPTELARQLHKILERPQTNWMPRVRVPTLTARENDVLRLLAEGRSNKAIAKALALSPETVKDYLNGVYRKLEVRDRLSAVRRAGELGLV